jgi:hypothetical protein
MALLDMRVDEEREVVPTRLLLVRPTVLDDGEVKALLEFSVHAITRAMNHMQTVGVSGDLLNRFIFVDCNHGLWRCCFSGDVRGRSKERRSVKLRLRSWPFQSSLTHVERVFHRERY